MTISWFDYSRDVKTVATLGYVRGDGNTRDFRSGTLYVIDGETGETAWEYTFDPLKPYFEGVTFWRGVSASPDGKIHQCHRLMTGEHSFSIRHRCQIGAKPLWETNLTTPLEVSGIPIIATNGTISRYQRPRTLCDRHYLYPVPFAERGTTATLGSPKWHDPVRSWVVRGKGVAMDVGEYASRSRS